MEKDKGISRGRAGFRLDRSCVDHVYTSGNIIQGGKDAGLTTYRFSLDVQNAYDTVWRNGLWKKMSEIGIRGQMWRNDENYDGMCEKGCDAGRGNIQIC